jgi:hypothetical protein
VIKERVYETFGFGSDSCDVNSNWHEGEHFSKGKGVKIHLGKTSFEGK